ncbi:MAG: ABC transporter substrate-binding protein [Lachnospiraceae bacterium]|nr:ABC transporter substrate-binding protein [Lachnospiraceae bacterium]
MFKGLKKIMALLTLSALCLCGCQNDAEIQKDVEETTVRIGSMKGPTTLGLLSLMDEQEKGTAEGNYEFTMVTAADELLPMVIKGELDIALVPANVAAVLYQKTEGQIAVIDINTLGVLYMVSGDSSIANVKDLKGKTIYLTGKGTTPDFVLQYLLSANGIAVSDVTLEYKSEATEVAVLLAENPDAIGLLPQPFVTVACAQNEALSVVLDTTAEWKKIQGEDGSSLVTGVTVVRKAFWEEHEGAVANFMAEHKESAEYANTNVEQVAALAVEAGIIAKEPIAVKAIPNCNIVYIDGEEMKQALSGYLEVLYEQSPQSVGGVLPNDDFYYVK